MSAPAPFRHTVIRASAGTGKTYQLSSRFIGLLATGVPPDQILATTFTRKAAGEILDRVLLRLAQAATDERATRELAEAIGDPSFNRGRARKLLVETVRSLHRLRVGTLDSYFLQVAGGFSLELGLPPGWAICDELADERLRDEAIEDLLDRGRLPELLTLVNLLAKGEAVRGISRIVRDTVSQLLGLYRQAAPPAWQQVPQPKGLSADQLQKVIDRIAAIQLPNAQWDKARAGDLMHAQLSNWDELLKAGLAAKVLDGEATYYKKPIPAELIDLYGKLLTHAKSVLVGQVAQQTEATHRLLARFAEHYFARQASQRALRFDDVTHRLAESLGVNRPERLAFRMDGVIRHLLLDEFQDTSPVQWQVLRPLAQSLTQESKASFFCVGDTKQAIYGWRGGVAEIFDALDGELTGLTGQSLAKSYRSSQPVIDAVNQVFQHLTQHPNLDKLADGASQWQRQFPEHSTAKTDLPGYVRLEFASAVGDDEDQTEKLFEFAANAVAEHARQAPQCSLGVLVRTNAAVARMIYLLRQRGVPASEEGGNPLIDSPAVELLLSLLRLADHPGDSIARFHLASSPLAGPLELPDHRDAQAAARLARGIRRRLLDEGYGQVAFEWAQRLAEFCDRRDRSRLQQLVELAYEYQPQSTLRADDFIALVESRRIADPSSADVRVMTIHQAKGLEFDIVVLPELGGSLIGQTAPVVAGRPGPTQPVSVVCRYANENVRKFLPPALMQLFEDDRRREVAESLCVLYVAMTRAAHSLHMILPPPKANEKSLPKSFAGILRATLATGGQSATSGVVYERGDARWFERCRQRPSLRSEDSAAISSAEQAAATIRLSPPLLHRDRGLERTSPSSLEGGRHVSVARLLESTSAAFEHGTLVHALLEQVKWLDDGLPNNGLPDDAAWLAAASHALPTLAADCRPLADRLAELRRQLAQPPIATLFSKSWYQDPKNLGFADPSVANWRPGEVELDVQTERAFAIRVGEELLSGSIDRLVLIRRGGKPIAADVVDFKTDAHPAGDQRALADKVEFYRPQIEAYRQAAAKILSLQPRRITARLVFLAAGCVANV